MSIKSDRVDFEKLLNGIDPPATSVPSDSSYGTSTAAPVAPVVDNTTGAETMEVKMFDFDYDGTRKGLRKKARKTVKYIVEHIVPPDLLDDEYIQDKMEQDTETLLGLYMQIELNNVMQRSITESVSRGNNAPRQYEVFKQLTDAIQSINKQIVDTEQRLRKTYIDLKYEVRERGSDGGARMESLPGSPIVPQIGEDGSKTVTVTSSKDLIANAKSLYLKKMKEAEVIDGNS